MSNATAAQALGGFQTGSMGGNLYQYGIHTIDPRTGRPLTTGQIAQQLYSKMFTQPGTTEEDVRGSLQYGFAGANLRGMGFSESQQSILSDMFLRISRGQSPELANRQGISGNENPLLPQYDIFQSQTQTMQRGEQATLSGFQQAATDVENLSKTIRDLSDSMFQLKGRIQGLFSSDVGQGAATAAGGVANATGGIITSILGYLGLKSLIKGGGAGAAKAGGGALRAVGSKVAPALGGYLTGKAGKALGNAVHASPTTTRVGSVLASAGTGAAIGAAFAPETLGISALVGALIGGIGGFFGSGGGSAGFGASFGAKGGAAATVSPVGGVAPTTMYGAKDSSLWKGARGYHTGQDYPVPEGTTVVAAASGVVFNDNPGSDYGLSVQIDHGNGYQTLYGHLSAKLVRPGQQVNAGQMIGKSGATGNVTGPHLHFEVRKGKNNPVDPSGFLGSNNILGTSGGGGADAPVGSGSSGVDYVLSNLIGVKGFNLRTFGSASLGLDASSPGTSGGMTAPGDQQAWASQLLGRLGAPTTPSNLRAITTWMAQEGGHWSNTAMYNPLNTTMSEEGATVIKGNTAGVKAYTSWEQGMQATVDTLRLPAYKSVIAALMAGTDAGSVFSAIKSSPWGTKNLPSGGGSVGFGASLPQQVVGGSNKNVYINVTVSQASDEQAIAFAKRVKSYLETDREISLMGSM